MEWTVNDKWNKWEISSENDFIITTLALRTDSMHAKRMITYIIKLCICDDSTQIKAYQWYDITFVPRYISQGCETPKDKKHI